MEHLPFPRGFNRQVGLSVAYAWKIKTRQAIPSPAVALRIYKALEGQVRLTDILQCNQETVEIARIISRENQGEQKT